MHSSELFGWLDRYMKKAKLGKGKKNKPEANRKKEIKIVSAELNEIENEENRQNQ